MFFVSDIYIYSYQLLIYIYFLSSERYSTFHSIWIRETKCMVTTDGFDADVVEVMTMSFVICYANAKSMSDTKQIERKRTSNAFEYKLYILQKQCFLNRKKQIIEFEEWSEKLKSISTKILVKTNLSIDRRPAFEEWSQKGLKRDWMASRRERRFQLLIVFLKSQLIFKHKSKNILKFHFFKVLLNCIIILIQ